MALTQQGRRLAEEFYAETCRRVAELAAGLSGDERDTLAAMLGRVLVDNEVPMVFMEP